jgi:hypothetical protein
MNASNAKPIHHNPASARIGHRVVEVSVAGVAASPNGIGYLPIW